MSSAASTNERKCDQTLTLYPVQIAVMIMHHYPDNLDAAVRTTVDMLWAKVCSEPAEKEGGQQ
jgi:hypothetical protein